MSGDTIAIIAVGIALAGLILTSFRSLRGEIDGLRTEIGRLRAEINGIRAEIAALRERMAHLEGLLDGLREAIGGRVSAGS